MNKILLQISVFIIMGGTAMAAQQDKVIYDFTKAHDLAEWQVINDTVRGKDSFSK